MDIRERGLGAAAAYLERTGLRVLRPEVPVAGADLLALDGGTLVAVVVQVSGSAGGLEDTLDARALRALVAAVESRREGLAPGSAAVRVDLVNLLVIAEDRALLRHHRAVSRS